jgi:hypothetical protein
VLGSVQGGKLKTLDGYIEIELDSGPLAHGFSEAVAGDVVDTFTCYSMEVDC